MQDNDNFRWLKRKGYLHITPQINICRRRNEIVAKVTNPDYVSRYAFFPLIHSAINERKYKQVVLADEGDNPVIRKHSPKTAKRRPLHYASNMDALIFGYYASVLQRKYDERLFELDGLSDCIIAYRRIPTEVTNKNKGTVHFAKELFDAIRERASSEPTCVLTFDIKSFFSNLDHKLLYNAWADLLHQKKLPNDHLNVFKATTNFSYILLDDLRIRKKSKGRRNEFDEKRLSDIRRKGKMAFFESIEEFRQALKQKDLKVYKAPFTKKEGGKVVRMGIPQGLPISAVLANAYLLDFDKRVYNEVVKRFGGIYRRYSDDIIIVCNPSNTDEIQGFIKREILSQKIETSDQKTEQFIFKPTETTQGEKIIASSKVMNGSEKPGLPLTYLGFEFYGSRTLLKSQSLAKFYRRMIFAVKRKSKIARHRAENMPECYPALFRRQLYNLYTLRNLQAIKIPTKYKWLAKNELGEFKLKTKSRKKKTGNYISYVNRASEIMDEPAISRQIRNHRKILHQAIRKHFLNRNNEAAS